jgi:hypothetical protein
MTLFYLKFKSNIIIKDNSCTENIGIQLLFEIFFQYGLYLMKYKKKKKVLFFVFVV